MKLWRTMTVSVTLVGACALTACGSSGDGAAVASKTGASASASRSAELDATFPDDPTPVPAITDTTAPTPTSATAAPDGESRIVPPQDVPGTAAVDARSPDEVIAAAGDKGQRYLGALRAAGIPATGMDAQEILYAEGVCKARADGMSRPDMVNEFAGIGQAYAAILPISAGQVGEIYVATAESSYC